jgi:Protein of unknown function (DUF1812).
MMISENKNRGNVCVLVASLFLLCGCIYDDPDCLTGVELRFTYTLNTRNIDLFDQQVEDVTLFLYNEQGKRVLKKEVSTNALTDNNSLYLDLPPGNYRVITWGNLDNNNFDWRRSESFSNFRLDLLCAEGGEVTHHHNPLFHGAATIEVIDRQKEKSTVALIKNTNIIHVIMQDDFPAARSGQKYAMISGCNGCYNIENKPVANSTLLKYRPKYSPGGNATQADFTVMRLFEEDDLELTLGWNGEEGVTNTQPLVAELMKHPEIKTNEDLDRWDEYTLTYKRDSFGAITLVKINDWEVIHNPGGI